MTAVSDVMTTPDASVILQIKDKLPKGFLINLVGKITAVSEIFRVKKDLLFLIELDNVIKIVVKKQNLVWQEQITPEVEYVFTNLRATTLQKGSTSQVRVFVPWSGSCLYESESVEYSPVTLQDWFHCRSITLPEPIPTETGVSTSQDNFVAYKGVVTSCDRSSVGIFELDHRVGLYVTCVPASHRFTALTLGTKIIVYNAHRKGFAMAPKIRLFCCMASCVRVVDTGQEQSSKKQFSTQNLLLKPISVYSLAAPDVAALLDMPSVLTQKLQNQQRGLPLSGTTPLIPVILSNSCCPWLQEQPRNLLQEFLESPHACCVSRGQSRRRIPDLVNIGKETDDLSEKSHDLTDLRQKYYGSQLSVSHLNQQLYWSQVCETVEMCQGKLLIGYLQSNHVTGRLQLQDASGSVDLAVCSSNPPSSHVCCPTCVSPKPGHALTCPLVQPSLLGSIICVTKYKRIAERFLNIDVPNSYHIDTKYVSRSRHVLYLQISLTDCVLICLPSRLSGEGIIDETAKEKEFLESKDTSSSATPLKRKRQNDESHYGESTESQLVYISHKESLTTLSRKESPKLRFCVLGYLIGQGKSSSNDDSRIRNMQCGNLTSCKNKHQNSALVKLKENKGFENVNTSSLNLHPCKIDLNTSKPAALSKESGESGLSYSNSSKERTVHQQTDHKECCSGGSSQRISCTGWSCQEGSCSRRSFKGAAIGGCPGSVAAQPAVLLFQGNVGWYSVLQTGALYRLTALGQGGRFQPQLLETKMRKAVDSSHARVCVQVPHDVGVTHVFSTECLDPNILDVVKFPDFSEVLSSSFCETQVNLRGRIISRSHRPQTSSQAGLHRQSKPSDSLQQVNQQLGVSVLDDQCVYLQVRSLMSDAEIPVYMNLPTSSYPLGLVPGAGVEFLRLERKVSRAENVYCQFTAVSTVAFFQVSDSHRPTTNSLVQDRDTVKVPHQYIIDIWRCPTSSAEFTSTCYICHVMKLCLKCVCSACGSIVTTTGCSSQACTVTDTYLSAKVSILVDDGTSPAVVSFSNCPENVQRLLRLSVEQWCHLEVVAQEQGEVFMQQFVGEGESVLENFLMRLCNSQHVKRQCRMVLRHRVFQHGQQNTWRSGVLDINLMKKDEFAYRSVKANAMFETRCLPYLQLECMDLKEVAYDVW
ncbi:CST complex subunit CTC1-like isoform X2 [Haliotis asinina]|uniref:CST complex subunit CTC1-like isoform X2 n=1 Tax=Haliotis asinina TaxID=109174 RepID=UPI0035324560